MKKIKVYSTPRCGYCNMVKEFLKKNNLPYEELDVMSDARARDEMVTRSGQFSVPITDIDGKLVLGYDIDRLRELTK
jgi:glutaredoxin-like YruB-family protein